MTPLGNIDWFVMPKMKVRYDRYSRGRECDHIVSIDASMAVMAARRCVNARWTSDRAAELPRPEFLRLSEAIASSIWLAPLIRPGECFTMST